MLQCSEQARLLGSLKTRSDCSSEIIDSKEKAAIGRLLLFYSAILAAKLKNARLPAVCQLCCQPFRGGLMVALITLFVDGVTLNRSSGRMPITHAI